MKASPVEFQNRNGYLYCRVEGESSIQFCIDYMTAISAECKSRGYSRTLIVECMQGQLSTDEMYTICCRLSHIFRDMKMAFIDEHAAHDFKNRFAERVARNKGCDAKLFYDEQAAQGWLLDS